MSASLYVRRKPKTVNGKSLSDALKFIFRDKLGCDGYWSHLGITREYLQALADAKVEGADELLKMWDDCDGELQFRLVY